MRDLDTEKLIPVEVKTGTSLRQVLYKSCSTIAISGILHTGTPATSRLIADTRIFSRLLYGDAAGLRPGAILQATSRL